MTPEARRRISGLAQASGRSLSELSVAIGKDRTFLSVLLGGKRNTDPGVSAMMRLADELGVPLDYLLCRDNRFSVLANETADTVERHAVRLMNEVMQETQRRLAYAAQRPTIDDILQWWRANGGMLCSSAALDPYFDLINVPDQSDQVVVPHKVGPESLASIALKSHEPDRLLKLVEQMSSPARQQLVASYYAASTSPDRFEIALHQINISLNEVGEAFTVDYFRLLLPVKAGDGKSYVLSFCTAL